MLGEAFPTYTAEIAILLNMYPVTVFPNYANLLWWLIKCGEDWQPVDSVLLHHLFHRSEVDTFCNLLHYFLPVLQ